MNRIDRLSGILIMLQSSLSVKPKQICRRFDISIRTVYRDIKALEEAGVPIAGDSRSGYSLVEGYKLPPLMFSEEEASAFLVAERLVEKFTDQSLRINYKSGVDKIRSVMCLSEKEAMTKIETKIGHLDFRPSTPSGSQAGLQLLLDNIAKHTKLEIYYLSHSRNIYTQRVIDPIGVFFSMANWYLIGFCNTKKDYRTFRLSRIQQIIPTEIPISDKHPALETFLQDLKDKNDLQKVVIELSKSDFPIMDESKYYQGLVLQETKGDKLELHFMVFSLQRFARWYLSYMDIATISYPKELQRIASEIVKKGNLL